MFQFKQLNNSHLYELVTFLFKFMLNQRDIIQTNKREKMK